MHLSIFLKSNTSICLLSVPMQMSLFAAMTVGVPTAGAPSTACALFEGCGGKRYAPSVHKCVHRNTSRTLDESCPFICAKSPFASVVPGSGMFVEEDEPGESMEKLDGTGDGKTPWNAEFALIVEVGGACGR